MMGPEAPVESQCLIFAGKILKDDQSVESQAVKDGVTIHLVVRSNKVCRVPGISWDFLTCPPTFLLRTCSLIVPLSLADFLWFRPRLLSVRQCQEQWGQYYYHNCPSYQHGGWSWSGGTRFTPRNASD